MRIIGFTVSKVLAERKKTVQDKIEIKSGLNIDNISKEEIDISKNPSLKFDFSYSVSYEPEAGNILINGSVIALDEKDEGKEILKEWKKKKFTHHLKLSLFNFIMDKCNLKALHLEEELSLPFHIPLPKLSLGPDQKSEEKNKANYAG